MTARKAGRRRYGRDLVVPGRVVTPDEILRRDGLRAMSMCWSVPCMDSHLGRTQADRADQLQRLFAQLEPLQREVLDLRVRVDYPERPLLSCWIAHRTTSRCCSMPPSTGCVAVCQRHRSARHAHRPVRHARVQPCGRSVPQSDHSRTPRQAVPVRRTLPGRQRGDHRRVSIAATPLYEASARPSAPLDDPCRAATCCHLRRRTRSTSPPVAASADEPILVSRPGPRWPDWSTIAPEVCSTPAAGAEQIVCTGNGLPRRPPAPQGPAALAIQAASAATAPHPGRVGGEGRVGRSRRRPSA